MPLTCDCDSGNSDWYYHGPEGYSTLDTKRGRKCCSCGKRIVVGETVVAFSRFRPSNELHRVEQDIYGDEVPLTDWHMCEQCGDLFFSLEALGFCLYLGESMRDLAREYAEIYGKKAADKPQPRRC